MEANEIRSAYDLALVIMQECSSALVNPPNQFGMQPPVLDFFGQAIANLVSLHRDLLAEDY
jgi:hypothetical protein